jgi:DNA-binding response OmpR family regulator
MRVLVVEDDMALRESLEAGLAKAGYAVDTAEDGQVAELLGDQFPYDAVVLDLGLPGKPGLEVLAAWRKRGNVTPVIILTARDQWHEKVDGFAAGADDYLSKPFHHEELVARLQALLRRAKGNTQGGLELDGVALNEDTQEVTVDGQSHSLTGVEFRLLRYFMMNRGRILSKMQIDEHVYDLDADKESNVIEVYVRRLRQKIGKDRIRTRRGQGYVFGAAE